MKKYTTEKFIIKAKEIHKNFYDYTRVNYINNSTPIIIICPIHGEFNTQTPASHLNGRGCFICGKEKARLSRICTTKEFIEKAIKKHGTTYDYSISNYIEKNEPVEIICKIHGPFKQLPTDHYINGAGCPECKKRKII
jgi:hypothetical protein